jgi:hypothetical protein
MISSDLLPLLHVSPVSIIGSIKDLELSKLAYLNSCELVEFDMDNFSKELDFYMPNAIGNEIHINKSCESILEKNNFIVIKNVEKSNTMVVNSIVFLIEYLQRKNINNPFVILINKDESGDNFISMNPQLFNRTTIFKCE